MVNATGHAAAAVDIRSRLGDIDGFHSSAMGKLFACLMSTCENGNHQALPHWLSPIMGLQSGGGPAGAEPPMGPSAF